MRVISRATLREFWTKPGRRDSERPLRAWIAEVRQVRWRGPAEVKQKYRSASIVAGDRVVFNVAGNKYRLVVAVKYSAGIVFVRFVGTHADYDGIDAAEV